MTANLRAVAPAPAARQEVLRIAGRKVAGEGTIEVRNPYDGSLVGTVARARADQVREAFAIAAAYKPKLSRYDRQKILMATAEALRARKDALSDLITAESGLSKKDSLYEVGRAYDVFTLARGEQLFIGAVSDKQFQTLCAVIGRDDLAADPQLATNAQRVACRPELLGRLGETLRHLDSAELQQRLESAGIPFAPIVRPEQLVHDRHLIESGGLAPTQAEDGTATQTVLLPLLMGGRRLGVRGPLPRVGEHTRPILSRLGLAPHDIDALVADQVVAV